MPTHKEIRYAFFDRVNAKLSRELLRPTYPSKVLDNAINSCLKGYNINDKTLYEYLGPDRFLDFVYQQWQQKFGYYLLVDNPNISFNLEGLNATDVQNKREQFEAIFARIDAQNIFQKVSIP